MQLAEARQYVALELARACGIPAYFLSAEQTSMTYSNAVTERRSLVDFSLRPILKEALERNGFEYIGPCKICGGRGFEYKLNKTIAKIKKDDQGEAYFIYPGLAPVYGAVNKMLNVFGLGDKFVAPMPLQFGSSLKMLTPSANPDSWLPTFSGPLSGLTLKAIYNITGFLSESDIPVMVLYSQELKELIGIEEFVKHLIHVSITFFVR